MADPSLNRIAADPVRLKTLALLDEGPATAGELAPLLGESADVIALHLKALADEGLAAPVDGETPDDGGSLRYRALVRAMWDEEEWEALGVEEQKRLRHWILAMIESDAKEAIDSGTFGERPNAHSTRTVSMVDEKGWEDLSRVHADALEAIFAIEAECAERLAERGAEGIPVLSAMICSELPPRRDFDPNGQDSGS